MSLIARGARGISSWQATLFLALAGLGFLIAVQLQSEAPRVRYTSQERGPLVQTALTLQGQQDQLKATILATRDRIGKLEQSGQGSAVQVTTLNQELDAARLAAGLVPLHGPGLVLRLEDSAQAAQPGENAGDRLVSAHDVRTVVEELWLAGAEAVAVNDERIVATTAILDIGGSILVNSAYLAPPYDVAAIGPSDLYARLTASPGFADFVSARAKTFGIRVQFAELADLPIPAYAGTVSLRHSRSTATATPAPAPSETPPAGDRPTPGTSPVATKKP